jgi:hypothetical protein
MIFDSKPDGTPTLRKATDMGLELISMTTGTVLVSFVVVSVFTVVSLCLAYASSAEFG